MFNGLCSSVFVFAKHMGFIIGYLKTIHYIYGRSIRNKQNMKILFAFGCLQPGENDEYRSIWMESERGPIEVFGDYKIYISEGEVKNKKEFRELWEMSYPSATKWYQFQHLLVIMHYIHYVCIT